MDALAFTLESIRLRGSWIPNLRYTPENSHDEEKLRGGSFVGPLINKFKNFSQKIGLSKKNATKKDVGDKKRTKKNAAKKHVAKKNPSNNDGCKKDQAVVHVSRHRDMKTPHVVGTAMGLYRA
ncbi:hypothetical protein QR680_000483 [Steinernema hermaphroditum]|uniref:Uncharacterized protein n=1 Tax=Steinernema hermaphroditum TaxID=289476 RepID=A0AA39GWA5_9BILA|nr:hypothetical protein QR680_000483 [Steinernema hermaphroditum]